MKNNRRGSSPIHLTNKTAIALRKNAMREKKAALAFAAVFSLIFCALAVIIGMRYLWMVPVIVALTVLADAALLMRARSRYLLLIGQAICTESSARMMREDAQKQRRIQTAQADLARMKADLASPVRQEEAQPDEDEDDDLMPPQKTRQAYQTPEVSSSQSTRKVAPVQEGDAPRRRRRQTTLKVIRGDQAK